MGELYTFTVFDLSTRKNSLPKLGSSRNLRFAVGIPSERGQQNQEIGIPRKDSVRCVSVRCGSISRIEMIETGIFCDVRLLCLIQTRDDIEIGRQPATV